MSENIHLRVSKEKKNEIVNQARQEGLSLTAFILTAVNDKIQGTNKRG